jgi:hypothetical protein
MNPPVHLYAYMYFCMRIVPSRMGCPLLCVEFLSGHAHEKDIPFREDTHLGEFLGLSTLPQTHLPLSLLLTHAVPFPCREEMMELGEEDKGLSCLEFMRERFDAYAQGSKHERDMVERCFGAKCLLQAAEEGEFLHKLSTRQVSNLLSITRARLRERREISWHGCAWPTPCE